MQNVVIVSVVLANDLVVVVVVAVACIFLWLQNTVLLIVSPQGTEGPAFS